MPMINFHSARLSDPDKYDDYRYTHGGNLYGGKLKIPSTIDVVWGHAKGGPKDAFVPQALRFPTDNFTADEAKKWLEDHKIKHSEFAAAKEKKEEQIMNKNFRKRFGSTSLVISLEEQFVSLRDALSAAITTVFGGGAYVCDFSDSEIIFRPPSVNGASSQTVLPDNVYFKVGYKLENGEAVLVGDPVEVERKTVYESISTEEFVKILEVERQLKKKEK